MNLLNRQELEQFAQISLIASLSLIIFSTVTLILTFGISFFAKQLGYYNLVVNLQPWLILIFVTLLVFLIMSASIFVSDRVVLKHYNKLQAKFAFNIFLTISGLLAFVVIIGTYLGLSSFLIYIKQSFWP